MLHTKEAKLKYYHTSFEVETSGDYVLCAMSKQKIPLDMVRYWNVDTQEPYANPEIVLKAYQNRNVAK